MRSFYFLNFLIYLTTIQSSIEANPRLVNRHRGLRDNPVILTPTVEDGVEVALVIVPASDIDGVAYQPLGEKTQLRINF